MSEIKLSQEDICFLEKLHLKYKLQYFKMDKDGLKTNCDLLLSDDISVMDYHNILMEIAKKLKLSLNSNFKISLKSHFQIHVEKL